MKICVTPGLAKSELLSEVVKYLVREVGYPPVWGDFHVLSVLVPL